MKPGLAAWTKEVTTWPLRLNRPSVNVTPEDFKTDEALLTSLHSPIIVVVRGVEVIQYFHCGCRRGQEGGRRCFTVISYTRTASASRATLVSHARPTSATRTTFISYAGPASA